MQNVPSVPRHSPVANFILATEHDGPLRLSAERIEERVFVLIEGDAVAGGLTEISHADWIAARDSFTALNDGLNALAAEVASEIAEDMGLKIVI